MPTKKEKKLIPLRVRVFFGSSLLMFCVAMYQALLRPQLLKDQGEERERNLPAVEVAATLPTSETLPTSNQAVPAPRETVVETPALTLVEEATTGPQFLHQWYQIFSAKELTLLNQMMDPVFKRNPTIKQFWKAYNINAFIDGIETHRLQPEKITLLGSFEGGEEYAYELKYTLLPAYQGLQFHEKRKAKIKFTEQGPRLFSLYCETTKCSHNPFFRPDKY